MLTGDKIETAINIGFSAGLLDHSMQQFILSSVNDLEIKHLLNEAKSATDLKKVALIIGGESLTKIAAEPELK